MNMKINILEYLEQTVRTNPDKTAVIDGERSITFSKLVNHAKFLASEIRNAEYSLNRPIAVYLPKSIESVIADFAITYSGNCYMNLDIKSPVSRTSNIIDLVEPVIIITNTAFSETAGEINSSSAILNIDSIISLDKFYVIDETEITTCRNTIIDTDPYCIINTSGSTGTPKSVVLNYKSFIDFTEWALKTLQISDNEIIGSLSPLVFDIYSFELCMLASKSSTLVLIPENLAAFPFNMLKLMSIREVSFIFWVPTIMVNIANMDLLSEIELPLLKTVWFAGEVFPTKQFNYWKSHLRNSKFVNLYGPIEITLDCTYFMVDRELKDDEPIPIGFPCRNTDILILNENNVLTGTNEEGELCIRGTSLAMGYYNNPEKTAAAFVQNPLNNSYPEIIYRTGDIVYRNNSGEIMFKGRKDSLIKHLGYRIELGEIEHVIINSLKLVENGCVVYNTANKEITLFYVSGNEITIAEMKKSIALALPKYMIPTVFIKMEELPRNTNGKIDRLFLNKKVNDDQN